MTTDRFKYKKNECIYACVALLLFFQSYLQDSIALFQYFDEFIAVCCLLEIFIKMIRGELKSDDASLLIVVFLIAVIGLLGNATAMVQTNWKPIATDIGNTFKVFIVYIGAKIMLRKSDRQKIVGILAMFIKIFVWILFVFMVLHELHIVPMGNDVRFGLRSFQFINHVAGQLSMMFYYIILILTLDMGYQKKKMSISTIVAIIVWLSTLRSRAFMYCISYLFLYRIIIKKEKKFRFSLKTVVPIIGILYFFAVDQIEAYFVNTSAPRSKLLVYGVHTMKRFFPLGSGFATYGTDAAVKYYSKLYIEYGFNKVYGLNRLQPMFAHDTYWPAIMGQFGVFGTVLMIVLVYKLCKDILKRTKNDNYMFFAALFIVITQVSSSIATSTFFNPVTVGLFFIVPLMFSDEGEKHESTDFKNYTR